MFIPLLIVLCISLSIPLSHAYEEGHIPNRQQQEQLKEIARQLAQNAPAIHQALRAMQEKRKAQQKAICDDLKKASNTPLSANFVEN